MVFFECKKYAIRTLLPERNENLRDEFFLLPRARVKCETEPDNDEFFFGGDRHELPLVARHRIFVVPLGYW